MPSIFSSPRLQATLSSLNVSMDTTYECNHTCRCKDTNKIYTVWLDCQTHVTDRHRHPGCKTSCPGFNLLFSSPQKLRLKPSQFVVKESWREEEEKKMIKKQELEEDLAILTTPPYRSARRRSMRSATSGSNSPAGDDTGSTDSENLCLDKSQIPTLSFFKCAHTCRCSGSYSTISSMDGSVFHRRTGAQRHMTTAARHPQCTSKCPAFKWLGVSAFNVAEPVEVPANRTSQDSPVTTRKRRDYEREQATSSQSSAKKSRVEAPSSQPSVPRPPRFGIPSRMPTQIPLSTPATTTNKDSTKAPQMPLSTPESISTFSSQTSALIPSSPLATNQFAPLLVRPINTRLTGRSLLMQHYSALNCLSKYLTQIPPELEALSMSLYLLPHATPDTIHFVVGNDTNDTGTVVSTITAALGAVNKVRDAVQEILQIEDPAGLLDVQDPDMRELRRRVAKLSDYLFDLRLDLKKASKTKEGLIAKKGRLREGVLHVNREIAEAAKTMKELMVSTLNRLEVS